ncbi:unnamed protein product [Ambrosiozyma monospora]|uniref:Unnamed protein product n=1 Tax=Ambrosiozyma monospora TaxID=43982 RepID=A0ACB5TLG5_AMBMO|nr:unnamed protein product [Ambrosiozyma monospora]
MMPSPNPLAIEAANAANQAAAAYKTKQQQQHHHATGINFANFNQDFTCISVGYQSGYRIYNCDPFGQCFQRRDGSIGIVEMLFCSSLLAIVGIGEQPALSPRRLKVINSKRQTTICELTFPGTILSVKMNRERLVVLLEETIYIYDINNMRLLHTIEIPPNPNGLLALSPNAENNYLAYPSPQKVMNANSQDQMGGNTAGSNNIRNGDVIIFNAQTLQPLSVIEAHKTQLAAICLSKDGTLLATASDKGTIVRVFSVETGVKLYQFRRGTYPTKIYSLAFSPDNRFIIASSATETVHIFRLGEEEAANTKKATNKRLRIPNNKPTASTVPGDIDRQTSSDEEDVDDDDEDVDDEEDEDGDVLEPLPSGLTSGRKVSVDSTSSVTSGGGEDSLINKPEPMVDNSRRSVARMLRRTSQSLGRKAAEKMGTSRC